MNCVKCSIQFNLGLNKPIKLCCLVLCYSCVYQLKTQNSLCPSCSSPYPPLDSLVPDTSLIESLWNLSVLSNQPKPSPNTSASGTCNLCKSTKASKSFSKMNSGLCESCSQSLYLYKAPLEQLRCSKGHRFIHTDIEVNTTKNCSLCNFQSHTNTHCLYCNIHICKTCSDTLKESISCINLLACPCSGSFIWQDFNKCKSCSVCKEGNNSIGRFLCLKCGKAFCVFCISHLFDLTQCCKCSEEFSQANKPVVFENKKLICRPCGEGLTGLSENKDLSKIFNKKCKGEHRYVKLNGKTGKCEICKGKGMFYCGICQFLVCNNCYLWVSTSSLAPAVKCIRGHYLRKTLISGECHKNNKPACRTCKMTVNELSTFCKTCLVDQCEDCYSFFNRLNTQKIVLNCTCGGSYNWVHNKPCEKCSSCSNDYKKSGSFLCNKCKKTTCVPCIKLLGTDFCANCKHSGANGSISLKKLPCKHFLCLTCYELASNSPSPQCPLDQTELVLTLSQVSNPPNCENHFFQNQYQYKTLCQVCKKMKDNLSYCENCVFLACKSCKTWILESSPINKNFTCTEGHELRLTPKAERFYKRDGKYKCDGCLELTHGTSAHCLMCKMDYCSKCLGKMNSVNSFFDIFLCGCNGKIAWDQSKAGGSCSKCKAKTNKGGLYSCKGCKKNWCIKCVAGGRKESCNVCESVFLKKGVKPVLAGNGLIVCQGCFGTAGGIH